MSYKQSREEAIEMAKTNPEAALEQCAYFDTKPWACEVFTIAITADAESAFRFANHYVNRPDAKEWVRPLLEEAAKKNPASAFKHLDKYKHLPCSKQVLLNAVDTSALAAQSAENIWKDLSYANEIRHTMQYRLPKGGAPAPQASGDSAKFVQSIVNAGRRGDHGFQESGRG